MSIYGKQSDAHRGELEILAAELRETLRARFRAIGEELKAVMPGGVGFALLVFDMGPGGSLAYASNAQRDDMVKALREFLEKVERGGAPSVFDGGSKA